MKKFALTEIDSEDFEDFIFKVEESFLIKFERNDFIDVETYGDFSRLVLNKIDGQTDNSCTSQQLFNKFRSSVDKLGIDSKMVYPKTDLTYILPRKNRRKTVKNIEKELGIKLNILTPTNEIKGLILLAFILLCCSCFYYDWKIVVSGFGILFLFTNIAYRFGKELKVKTVTELVDKVVKENYKNSRRNKESYNKQEVETVLEKWFIEEFSLEIKMAN